MLHWLGKFRDAVQGRVARWHSGITLLPDNLTMLLEAAAACEREEVARLQGDIASQRAEIEGQRAEIDQLRLDNRALLNSLLGTAGIPPIEVPRTAAAAPAVRRPSWPQLAAKKEIAAARKSEAMRIDGDKQQEQTSQGSPADLSR